MMDRANKKQDDDNKNQPSMSELFAKKRAEAEAALAEKGNKAPQEDEVAARKARLLAQRDLLRKQKEEKRQQELEMFNKKTETKEDLFTELKRMDDDVKLKAEAKKKEEEAARRLEMYRKVRQEINTEKKQENEANYNKRVAELEAKDAGGKKKDEDDWLKNAVDVGRDDDY